MRRHPITAAVAILLLAFFGYATYLTVSLPSVTFLRTANPETTSLMAAREAEARDHGEELTKRHSWIPLRQVSERLKQAVLMGEDAGFYGHRGFDFHEIRESIKKNLARGEYARGASTITQQLAKNLFLSTEKTLPRKLKEAILTYRLERALSKNRILEIYLNVIEWGDGIYGVEAASMMYFGKPARYLGAAEAALLAAMIPNPRRLHPARAMDSLEIRQERILGWMHRAGHLTEEELERAKSKRLELRVGGST